MNWASALRLRDSRVGGLLPAPKSSVQPRQLV